MITSIFSVLGNDWLISCCRYSSITEEVLPANFNTDSPKEQSALHREVLLSYRLLFGQSSRSRKQVGKELSHLSKTVSKTQNCHSITNSQHPSTSSSNVITTHIDPFLSTICTMPLLSRLRFFSSTSQKKHYDLLPGALFPSSALDIHDQLQECDTYSACDDFPIFGHRLLKLQRYSMRQQPSRVRDFWRDRRNPLQWYTFWAVLWIGGLTSALAVLQLVVGVVQIAVTIRP